MLLGNFGLVGAEVLPRRPGLVEAWVLLQMLELVEALLGLEPEAGIWFARALGSPLQRAVQQRAEEFEWELVHWGVAGNPDLDFEKDFPEDFSARILALPDCGRLAEGSG